MIIVVFAVLTALCGGAIALAEARDRPVRRAEKLARERQQQQGAAGEQQAREGADRQAGAEVITERGGGEGGRRDQ